MLRLFPLTLFVLIAHCGTNAVASSSCRQVETARCRRAAECGTPLSNPPHPDDDVDACIRFYDTACRHGIVAPAEPAPESVNACVQAIRTGACTVVNTPESDPSCAFLIPPSAPVDASADSSLADASAD